MDQLSEENRRTSDLALIEDLEEAYSLLARKTLKSMVYAHENYKFRYILKVGLFIVLYNLLGWLRLIC